MIVFALFFTALLLVLGLRSLDELFTSAIRSGNLTILHALQPEIIPALILVSLAGVATTFTIKSVPASFRFPALLQLIGIFALASYLLSETKLPIFPLSLSSIILLAYLLGLFLRRYAQDQEQMRNKDLKLQLQSLDLNAAKLELITQDERDRRLMASDLHDQVLNDLKVLKISLKKLENNKLDQTAITELNKQIENASSQIRQVMDSLFPSVLEDLGLIAALNDLLQSSAAKAGHMVRLNTSFDDDQLHFDNIEKLLIYRIIQEGLNNVVKHARAKQVQLTVTREGDEIIFLLQDDGCGFEEIDGNQSRGIRYIEQRAALINGRIKIECPGKDKGVKFELRISVKQGR
ncbi:MAG: hypothetical protein K2Y32_18910 [Candidatus Obscuribacterales bacterium]|nr:hypothetical protein [Candidatus Obscuribacterales bacterium]